MSVLSALSFCLNISKNSNYDKRRLEQNRSFCIYIAVNVDFKTFCPLDNNKRMKSYSLLSYFRTLLFKKNTWIDLLSNVEHLFCLVCTLIGVLLSLLLVCCSCYFFCVSNNLAIRSKLWLCWWNKNIIWFSIGRWQCHLQVKTGVSFYDSYYGRFSGGYQWRYVERCICCFCSPVVGCTCISGVFIDLSQRSASNYGGKQ